jgi:hypothetical protein
MRRHAFLVLPLLTVLTGCKAFGGVAMGLGRVAGTAAVGLAKAAPAIASGVARAAPVIARGAVQAGAQATTALARATATTSRVLIEAHPVDYSRPPGGTIYVDDSDEQSYYEPPTPWGPPPPQPTYSDDACSRCPSWMECNDCLDNQGYACGLAPEGAPARCHALPQSTE